MNKRFSRYGPVKDVYMKTRCKNQNSWKCILNLTIILISHGCQICNYKYLTNLTQLSRKQGGWQLLWTLFIGFKFFCFDFRHFMCYRGKGYYISEKNFIKQ